MLSSRTAQPYTVSEAKLNIRKMEFYVKKRKFPHSVIRNQICSFLSFLSKVKTQLKTIKTVLSYAPQNCFDKEDCIFNQR
jgi:hypothetical protein